MTNPSGQSEAEFPAAYDARNYNAPLTTVDMAIFSLIEGQLQVLLVQRAEHPARGLWALPGGFIDLQRDNAAYRKLKQKTGIDLAYLDQVASTGNQHRDPRGWSLTVLYYALIDAGDVVPQADPSASHVQWFQVQQARQLDLAFDHRALLAAAHERLKTKVEYTALPLHLIPPEFTLSELQQVFETILEKPLEKKSFRRRMLDAELLQDSGKLRRAGTRPAQLYRFNPSDGDHLFARSPQGKRALHHG